jgi:hypothetical protein
MKLSLRPIKRRPFLSGGVLALVLALSSAASAQTLGRALQDFPNARANKTETPFGRLVADSLMQNGSDAAWVNAGALRSGTLEAGSIEREEVESLLSFGEDDVVTLQLSGAQVRAALERAAGVYPTGSPAFLHCAGITARFDGGAAPGQRVSSIRIKGGALDERGSYAVTMPVSLAEGAAGYFNIWNGAQARPANITLLDAVAAHVRSRGEVSPDATARFGPK